MPRDAIEETLRIRSIYCLIFLVWLVLLAGEAVKGDSAAQQYRITFKVMAQNVPAGAKLFIVGNDEKLGGWNPGAVALEKQDDGS